MTDSCEAKTDMAAETELAVGNESRNDRKTLRIQQYGSQSRTVVAGSSESD